MRQSGTETAPRFLECGSRKGVLAGQRQDLDQFTIIREGSCLEQMVSNLACALVDSTGIDQLDRVGDRGVQLLCARARDIGKQRLTHKFMGEGKRLLGSLGAGNDYSHLLRLLDDGKEFVDIDLAYRSEKLKTEAAPDHR